MNDIPVNWKLITKGMPHGNHAANDRAPTIEEIKETTGYIPDPSIKPIVLIMISSGIRVGAFDYLKYKHIIPLEDEEGKIVAAKMIVYAGEPEQYPTFITPKHTMYGLNGLMENTISQRTVELGIHKPASF